MRKLKILLIFLIIIYLFLFVYYYSFYFEKYVNLALRSVKADCELIPSLSYSNQLTDENLKNSGVVGYFDSEKNSITILVDKKSEDYVRTLRHEMCHYDYYLSGIKNDCNNKIKLFLEELNCYYKESL